MNATTDCLMGRDPHKYAPCHPTHCATCGFNPAVERERKRKLKTDLHALEGKK